MGSKALEPLGEVNQEVGGSNGLDEGWSRLASLMRTLEFETPLVVPVSGVTKRRAVLVEGPIGWGEYSPLASWGPRELGNARRAAIEAACGIPDVGDAKRLAASRSLGAEPPRPAPSAGVEVNVMVPELPLRGAVDLATRLVSATGSRVVKVKVGDRLGMDRIRAVRDALPDVVLRADAGGLWDQETASQSLKRLASLGVELAEDPVTDLEELAQLRRKSPVPVAAEKSVTSLEDAQLLRRLDAADAVVLKPQRLGGVARALEVAEAAGVAAIASSALETSVGLVAVLALACLLPPSPFAHGVGTAALLAEDVTTSPLVPRGGKLEYRIVVPDRLLAAASGESGT